MPDRRCAGRQVALMYASAGYQVSRYMDHAWLLWTDLFRTVPYWDPYGALPG